MSEEIEICEDEKMRENILDIIKRYESASSEAVKYQKEIIRLICDAVRDTIPDIEGWVGTPENQNLMYFNSETLSKRFDKALDEKACKGWRSIDFLIEEVFPELEFKVIDFNATYLTPEEQAEIKERLEKLKRSEGGKDEKQSKYDSTNL